MEENKNIDSNQNVQNPEQPVQNNAEGGIISTTGEGFKEIATGISSKLSKKNKKDEEQSITDAVASGNYSAETNSLASGEGIVKKLSKKINDAYENFGPVKQAREKREASLVPLVLNPEVDGVRSEEKVVYKYVARNEKGKVITDYFPAFSKMDVYSYLQDQKMIVYEISTSKGTSFLHSESGSFKTKMGTKDLVFWLAQLSTYIKAGIPLTDAVKVLAQQDKRKKYKTLYDSIIYELTTGQTFSEALRRQGAAFPPLLVNMIKSSEMTGSVEKTLDEMSEYYQEILDTRKSIISAMAYPSVVMVFAIGIVIFMLTYIVPKFVDVYASMGSEINAITQICLDLSAFLKTKYTYLLLGILVLVLGFRYSYKYIKSFRTFMQRIFMHLPVVGKLIISKELSMFSRTFASLQKNNVLLTDSIDILAKITTNEIYKDLMLRTINNLIKGNKMSETFADHWAIPEIAYFMIVTGESTGELAEMLDKVADYYQKEQKSTVATIKTFIEPVMIVSLAVTVGFILVAILIPMFDMYSLVS